MPYISKIARKTLKSKPEPIHAGEINYLFTLAYIKSAKIKTEVKRREFVKSQMIKVVKSYLRTNPKNYQTFNDIAGAISLSVAELSRRRGLASGTNNMNIWHDALLAGMDVQDWLVQKYVNTYEDAKISENGDVY